MDLDTDRHLENGSMKPFENTLIVGTGPAAIQIAVNLTKGWSNKIGLANRRGEHSREFRKELEENGNRINVNVHGEKYRQLSGKSVISRFYEGFEKIEDIWKTVVICTPCDSYRSVITDMKINTLKNVKTIILVSPGIGSNILVTSQLHDKENIDVISLSTYYAATKFSSVGKSFTTSVTKALKKRIYLASNRGSTYIVFQLKRFLERIGVEGFIANSPLDAEGRNITTYVHPPFFINDFSLNEIFSRNVSMKAMYKLYPEGPITQHTIRSMLLLWKEVSKVLTFLDSEPINLLKFLNDDNYPVHDITIARDDIENFPCYEEIKQEYLLYIRYSSILIDPYDHPDENGKYFDFSAVPYKQIRQDQDGRWIIPRVPFEDYRKLNLVYALAQKFMIPMPETSKLLTRFRDKLDHFIKEIGVDSLHPDMIVDSTMEDAEIIFSELGPVK